MKAETEEPKDIIYSPPFIRTGFTTSACACAAAAAAVKALLTQKALSEITIHLPSVKNVKFILYRCEISENCALCSVIKDSGDDINDVTNGIEIQALAELKTDLGIEVLGGQGVGKVTLPGLPVQVGEAAINPMPRRLIVEAVRAALADCNGAEGKGIRITIQVPQGEEIAHKTMNPELGILGGISILGTDGIQRPFSQPSFRASIFYALKVHRLKGCDKVGITSGRRSLAALKKTLSSREQIYFTEVGDEIGYALSQASRLGYKSGYIGIMPGKLSKLAQGRLQTHVNYGKVDFDFLSEVGKKASISKDIIENIPKATTVHQVISWLSDAEKLRFLTELAKQAVIHCKRAADNRMSITLFVFSIKGECYLSYTLEEAYHA